MSNANDASQPTSEQRDATDSLTQDGSTPINIQAVPPEPATPAEGPQAAPEPPSEPWLTPARVTAQSGLLDIAMAVMALVLAFFLGSFIARNTDTWMHLATGRILASGDYQLASDPFAYTTEGRSWINHSWLYDLGVYHLVDALGGPENATAGALLVALKAIILTALAAVLLAIRRPEQSLWLPVGCVAVALVAMSPRFHLQPAAFSFLFMATTLLVLYRANAAEPTETSDPSPPRAWRVLLFGLPLLFALWANLDDWYVLGPVLVALFLAGQIVQRAIPTPGESTSSVKGIVALAVVLVLGVAACLLTPYTTQGLTLPQELWALFSAGDIHSDPAFQNYFQYGLDRNYVSEPAGWAYLAMIGLGVGSFAATRAHVRWWRAIVWSAFLLLSIVMARSVPFFALVAAPITALNFQEFLAARQLTSKHLSTDQQTWALAGRAGSVVAGLALLALAWAGWLHASPDDPQRTRHVAWGVDVDPSLRATAAELRALRQRNVLRADSRGFLYAPDLVNYCAWFCPEEKGFFDYRFALFGDIGDEYLDLRHQIASYPRPVQEAKQPWIKRFQDYGIDHLVINSPDRESVLRIMQHFWSARDEWPLLYLNGRGCILGWKNSQTSSSVGAQFEGARFNGARAAFARREELAVPENGLGAPPRRASWTTFLKGPAPRPAGVDDSQAYLRLFDVVDSSLPGYVWATIVTGSGAMGAGGGGALPLAAVLGPLGRAPMGVLKRTELPPGEILLAIRAARRAVDASPENADCHVALALGYQRLWTAEEAPTLGSRNSRLQQLRQVLVMSALQNAVALRPDWPVAHFDLAEAYKRLGYLDLELEERQECVRASRAEGPGPRELPQDFDERIEKLDQLLHERERETRIDEVRNDYELNANGKPPAAQVQEAMNRGLVKEALDILRRTSVNELGPDVAQILIHLDVLTGQFEELFRAQVGLPDWYGVMVSWSLGDYDRADEMLRQMIDGKERDLAAELVMLTRQELFVGQIDPLLPLQLTQRAAAAYEVADLRILRGLLALEIGNTARAQELLAQALDIGRAAPRSPLAVAPLGASSALAAAGTAAASVDAARVPGVQAANVPVARRYLLALRQASAISP
jgi:tetratricopeptide (TPR) repeat protein